MAAILTTSIRPKAFGILSESDDAIIEKQKASRRQLNLGGSL